MTELLRLALASAWNRRATLGLTVVSIALSVALLLGVERARLAARDSFAQSVSGTDLIVGARTSPVQLMLYAVFRLGEATNNVRWSSFDNIARLPTVAWAVPLSLGDSHRGYAVLGTSPAYFEHFRYGDAHALDLRAGRAFSGTVDGVFEAVLGADVAEALGYGLGQQITLSHGMGAAGSALPEHANKPFTVVGILARTGTPVDRTVHISVQAIEAIHLDWQAGAPLPGFTIPAEMVRKFDLQPKTLTAMLVGLKSRGTVFRVQRAINNDAAEPLLAVLPGVALDQLWQVVGVVERTLLGISAMVVAVGIAGMVAVVLASLNERRRELAILRSVGAGPRHIVGLLIGESLLVTLAGATLGTLLLAVLVLALGPWIESTWGVHLPWAVRDGNEGRMLALVAAAGLVAGVLPAWRASRLALADGLTPKL